MRSNRTDKTLGGWGYTEGGFCGQFLLLILLFSFAVATCWLVHNMETMFYLSYM